MGARFLSHLSKTNAQKRNVWLDAAQKAADQEVDFIETPYARKAGFFTMTEVWTTTAGRFCGAESAEPTSGSEFGLLKRNATRRLRLA